MNLEHMDYEDKLAYERELDILESMTHPLIIEFKEQFLYKEKVCLVTEFASDGDFKSLMEK